MNRSTFPRDLDELHALRVPIGAPIAPSRLLFDATNARFVDRHLVVSCLRGIRHASLGDRPRVVLDVRDPDAPEDGDGPVRLWDKIDEALGAHIVHWRSLPLRDGFPVPAEAAQEAVEWYAGVRALWGEDMLVIVHCFAGRQRSATIAYALLRAVHGLSHAEALARVGERVERCDRPSLYPTWDLYRHVAEWCDARVNAAR